MTPETADRWANEMRLTTQERKIWLGFASRIELTIPDMLDLSYADREDGGPLTARACVRQVLHSLRKKLGDRGTIHTKHLFELELHAGRR